MLNELAPEGTSFGAHEGDGSDFGFWTYEEMEGGGVINGRHRCTIRLISSVLRRGSALGGAGTGNLAEQEADMTDLTRVSCLNPQSLDSIDNLCDCHYTYPI